MSQKSSVVQVMHSVQLALKSDRLNGLFAINSDCCVSHPLFFPPFPIELSITSALNPINEHRCAFASGERENIRRCAHDGLERQTKEINVLNVSVCVACAVRYGALGELQ
jgi:hypothetical protein